MLCVCWSRYSLCESAHRHWANFLLLRQWFLWGNQCILWMLNLWKVQLSVFLPVSFLLYLYHLIMFGSYSKDVALVLSNLKQEFNRLKNVRELSQNSVDPNTEGKTLESPLTELPIYIEKLIEYSKI